MTRGLNPHAILGGGLVLLGLLLFASAADIEVSPAVVLLGPRLFPSFVAVGLMVLGILTIVTARTEVRSDVSEGEDAAAGAAPAENDWPAFATALAGPVLFLLTVEMLGFAIATALLFAAVARAFGSRRLAFDLLIGLGMGALILLIFSKGLGLVLPVGEVFAPFAGG